MPKHANRTSFKPDDNHVYWKGGCYKYWHRKAREKHRVPNGIVVHFKTREYSNISKNNLMFLTPSEHCALHNKQRKGTYKTNSLKRRFNKNINKMTSEGMSSREIAKILGISKNTVLRSRKVKL